MSIERGQSADTASWRKLHSTEALQPALYLLHGQETQGDPFPNASHRQLPEQSKRRHHGLRNEHK